MANKTIIYNPKIPRLESMTEREKDRALEEYMRESERQINIIIGQLSKEDHTDD